MLLAAGLEWVVVWALMLLAVVAWGSGKWSVDGILEK